MMSANGTPWRLDAKSKLDRGRFTGFDWSAKASRTNDIAYVSELVAVISLGYQPDMARIALRNEGSVEAAVEALMAGMGKVQDKKRKVTCSVRIF